MKRLYRPCPPVTLDSVVYDMPSPDGGTYTVQVVERNGDHVKVQTIYGALSRIDGGFIAFGDCLEFWTEEGKLTNRRLFTQPETDWRRGT